MNITTSSKTTTATPSNNQRSNNIPQTLSESQALLSSSSPPMMMITEEEEQQQQQQQTIKKKQKRIKRCHGNRKIQRFRKKCRAKGMKPATIAKQVNKRFNIVENQIGQVTTTNDSKIQNNSITISKNKRKRDLTTNRVVRSMSEQSIIQSPPKKMTKTKNNITAATTTTTTTTTMQMIIHNNIYRCAPYLKRLSSILLQALRLQLDHLLKKKSEQIFVYKRLQLLDKQYSLEVHRSLWQSCMNMSSQQQIWPDEIYTMFNTKEPHLCMQFVEKYINDIQHQLDHCNNTLMIQGSSCLESLLSLDLLDQRLKEYIYSQQKHFRHKIECQLSKFKDNIQEKQLYHTLFNNNNLLHEQKEILHRLMMIQDNQIESWKEFLMLEERILSKILPKNFDYMQNFITSSNIYSPIVHDDSSSIQYQLKQLKILQESKRIWLDIYLQAYILKIQQYDQYYQQELVKLEQHLNNRIDTTTLLLSVQAYMSSRRNRLKEEIYLQMSYFQVKLTCRRRRRRQYSSINKQMIGVSPEVILDVHHRHHDLNAVECEYLSRGGNYIRPNRTSLRPYSKRKKLVQEEHDKILKKTVEYLSKTCPSLPSISPLFKQFSQRLHGCLTLRYMTPLPYMDQIRAKQEREIVKSIRQKLKKGKLILRESDKSGNLYIGQKDVFEQKVIEYRQQTGAYEELSSNPLEAILIKVTRLLNDLHMKTKDLSPKQYKKMIPTRKEVELAYMYFNPKTHKDPITLRPIMNTIHAATTGISHFLDDLIRPLFNKHAKPKPIIDGSYLLRQLERYACNGYLKSTTLFCTFDINNLYTMLPQDESLKILEEFLEEHHYEKIKGIPIKVIRQLAEIVLKETAFFYENKYYKQIVGGAMGSPFTLTLANIFMLKWEKNTIYKELGSNEIYGRYIDDIFFTSNESKEKIKIILKKANDFHLNIKLEANIGSTVSFLDLLISNNNGILSSSVYHKPAAEPCVVPFISDHPRHIFSNTIQTILLRAVRYSSTLEIFQKEYRTIQLMLLYNGYPSKYIDTNFHDFFNQHLSMPSLLPLINDENQFLMIRNKLFAQPSVNEIQISRQIANIETNEDKKSENFENTLFLHYTHEKKLDPLKRDIHKIYSDVFQCTDAANIRLIIGHRNSRNIGSELIRKRPYSSFIKLKPSKPTNINNSSTTTT